MTRKVTRRAVVGGLIGGGLFTAVAAAERDEVRPDALGVGGVPGALIVPAGETYRVEDGGDETHTEVRVAGELSVQGRMEVSE